MQVRPPKSFTAKYLKGLVRAEEIDAYIDEWHKGGSGKELHDFLGMTWGEYAYWVEHGEFTNSLWLLDWYRCAEETDSAIDMLFRRVDNQLLAGRFVCVDELLCLVDLERLSISLLLAVLTITAAGRPPAFYERAEQRLQQLAPDRVEALLKGLR